jgi:calcineurin-like phosphoesterase family protein
MKDIWISSDFHFNHANILKFKDKDGKLFRGDRFADVHEMNDHMIEQHNKYVKPGDIFYTLGDVLFGIKEDFKKLWPRLNGSKRLIVGNHDDIPFLSSGGFFQKVMESREFREFGLMLTHRPAEISSMWDFKKDLPLKSVHGHIHQNPSPEGLYVNMSMEAINYTPVNIEELRIR